MGEENTAGPLGLSSAAKRPTKSVRWVQEQSMVALGEVVVAALLPPGLPVEEVLEGEAGEGTVHPELLHCRVAVFHQAHTGESVMAGQV